VYRIGREAVANALKHAKPARLDIEILYASCGLSMRVSDDGCGIEPEIVQSGRQGHWGLSGMRERAMRIGAQLRVLSRVNGGTEVEVIVPGSLAFGRVRPDLNVSRTEIGEHTHT